VLLGIIEANALLQVFSGEAKLSEPEQGRPQCPVRRHEESRVLPALGQGEKLISKLAGRLVLGPQ
jgi:hypothetical protein